MFVDDKLILEKGPIFYFLRFKLLVLPKVPFWDEPQGHDSKIVSFEICS